MARKFLTPIDLTQNELRNGVIQNLASAPGSPLVGQVYYDTTLNEFGVYSGLVWLYLTSASGTVASVTAGDGTVTIGGTGTNPTVRVAAGGLTHSYISDFDTQVNTHTLNQLAAATAAYSMGGFKLTNLANGSGAQDAAAFGQIPTALPPNGAATGDLTGTYPGPTLAATSNVVAIVVAAATHKQNVRLLSTANVVVATGTLLTIDGVTTVAGDRVLLVGQTTTTQNGIYVAGTGAWTRAPDMPNGASVLGADVNVMAGTAYGLSEWLQTNTVAATVGTTALTFAATGPFGGTGLTTTGQTFSVTYGTIAGTSAQGNDSRITGAIQSGGAAGGDLTGTYPNPTLSGTTNVLNIIKTVALNLMAVPTAAVAMGGFKITGLANGTVTTDAAAFGQIPTTLPPNGGAGGDLTGSYPNPTLSGTTNVENIIRANRLDQFAVPTAAVSWGSQALQNLLNPVNPQDAATKAYVDTTAQGLSVKPSVVAMSSANVALTAPQTIDGVAVTVGQRVLLTGQTTSSQNGIWLVAAGAWTRPTDFATGANEAGAFVFVESGTVNISSGWVLAGAGAITVDTTAQAWTQFSGAGEITATSPLLKTGNVISVIAAGIPVANGGTGGTSTAAAKTNLGFMTRYTQLVGGSTSQVITHGLGTQGVLVSVYDSATFAEVECDVTHTSTTTITLAFTVAPASNAYTVVVIG